MNRPPPLIAHFVSGFPVLSETFVQDEIQAFSRRGFRNLVVSLRPWPEGLDSQQEQRLMGGRTRADLGIEEVLYPWKYPTALVGAVSYWPRRALSTLSTLLAEGIQYPRELGRILVTAERAFEAALDLRGKGVIHCHSHFAHYPASLAWGCSRVLGCGFTWNAHSYDLFLYRAHLERKVCDAARIFPVSDRNRDFLRDLAARQGADPEKIEVIRCGIALADFPWRTTRVPGSPLRIVGVGRLVDTKGFDTLIQAVSLLVGEGDLDFLVEIIGEGPDRENLVTLTKHLGLEDRVRFVGALPREETRRRLAEADLCVLPCRSGANGLDGIPVVLMEAMALGTPVVSTVFAAIPELIEDQVSGLLAPPGHPGALSEAMGRIFRDSTLAESLSFAARKVVERTYSSAETYPRKAEIIARLLGQGL
ncbi:MAG: D-inositol-3-phosphate glycosyltransferase [bacterium]|nr:D-inositol-3-phosphate glycosyltransferase [bacterium]